MDAARTPLPLAQPTEVRLHRVAMPMRSPFATAHGTEAQKQCTIVEFSAEGITGWAECVALGAPDYSAEWADGAFEVLDRFLVPSLLRQGWNGGRILDGVVGNPMAKAAVEMAGIDLALRSGRRSLAAAIGATHDAVPGGAVVGLGKTAQVAAAVDHRISQGYRRIKLKLSAQTIIADIAAIVRSHPGVMFAADANGTLDPLDTGRLDAIDNLGLEYLEGPLRADDLDGHAVLAGRMRTPICLDEPIISVAELRRAVSSGACSVVNVKPGRMGGLGPAVDALEWCQAHSVPAWIGGMLETGIGRAVNIVLAAHPGASVTGDLAASDLYFDRDLCAPALLGPNGTLTVPSGPGAGVEVDTDYLAAVTIRAAEHQAR